MDIADLLYWILAIVLIWAAAAKLLTGSSLASSPGMRWATRPGLASGTIAGAVEALAAVLLILRAIDVIPTDLIPLLVGIGIAAHMGMAAFKHADRVEATEGTPAGPPEEESRIPNLVIGTLGLLVAFVAMLG